MKYTGKHTQKSCVVNPENSHPSMAARALFPESDRSRMGKRLFSHSFPIFLSIILRGAVYQTKAHEMPFQTQKNFVLIKRFVKVSLWIWINAQICGKIMGKLHIFGKNMWGWNDSLSLCEMSTHRLSRGRRAQSQASSSASRRESGARACPDTAPTARGGRGVLNIILLMSMGIYYRGGYRISERGGVRVTVKY